MVIATFALNPAAGHKYTKAANNNPKDDETSPPSLRTLEKPFKMLKMNNIWSKATLVSKCNGLWIEIIMDLFPASLRAEAKVALQRVEDTGQGRKHLEAP